MQKRGSRDIGVTQRLFSLYKIRKNYNAYSRGRVPSPGAHIAIEDAFDGRRFFVRLNKEDKIMSKRKLILAMLACLLVLVCTACGNSSNTSSQTEAARGSETEVIEQDEPEAEPEEPADSVVTPEFKAAMDSYEEFFDEYVGFMKKYQESDDPTSMMVDFADYMTKYSDVMTKLDEIDEDSLSAADLAYYTEVNARILKKLSEVS